MNQYEKIARLLTRKSGCTSMDIISVAGTVSPHSRLSELRAKGWRIWREAIKGKSYGKYFGQAPQAQGSP